MTNSQAGVDGFVVRAAGLTKTYPPHVHALAGVSLTVAPGEFVAVLGPSGAGKTTLFRCLTGLTRPDAGSVVAGGRDICQVHGRELSRLAEAGTWRVLLRRFAYADRQLALACLDAVGLLDRAWARADQLSGGQQQRVAIARALAQRAQVILADEPVASLDPESAVTVLDSLRSAAATGVAVVASLHQVHLAQAYADRIVALRAGKVVQDAPVGSVDARTLEQIYERNGASL